MQTMTVDRGSLLEEEIIILRNSGEIPEIALHTTLFYLLEDPEGPGLSLTEIELQNLHDATLARAQEIVLRDIDPSNRDLTMYRGVARSRVNWGRLQKLCRRINRECPGFRETVCCAFIAFLETELLDVSAGHRVSSVNCRVNELEEYCAELGLDSFRLPAGWFSLCRC